MHFLLIEIGTSRLSNSDKLWPTPPDTGAGFRRSVPHVNPRDADTPVCFQGKRVQFPSSFSACWDWNMLRTGNATLLGTMSEYGDDAQENGTISGRSPVSPELTVALPDSQADRLSVLPRADGDRGAGLGRDGQRPG